MAQSNNRTEWDPLAPVEKILTEVLNGREGYLFHRTGIIDEYLRLYERFREGHPDEILSFPEGVLSSREWYEDLFSPEGSLKQINLDHIGKDFLCMIYLTEVAKECFTQNKAKSLYLVLTDRKEGNEHNNLRNSLLWTEALVNFLSIYGWDLTIPERVEGKRSILLTDIKYKVREDENHPVVWMVETSRFSKLVRRMSVCLQNRGKLNDLKMITPESYGLSSELILLNERIVRNTFLYAINISVNREFRLWDRFRTLGFPSLRQIADYTEIPYSVLVDMRPKQADITQYTGTNLLNRIPIRYAERIIEDLMFRDRGGLDKLSKGGIL